MKIFGVAGKKQSGKTTLANFVYSKVLNSMGVESWLNGDGKVVLAVDDDRASLVDFDGAFGDSDVARKGIYPYFRAYYLADSLKGALQTFFGLDGDKLYGSNADKDSLTNYTVSDLYGKAPKGRYHKDKVTHREFMEEWARQQRSINDDVFRRATKLSIEVDNSSIVGIFDLRDQGDINFVKSMGGKVFKIENDPLNSQSPSDLTLDKIPIDDFDCVIGGSKEKMHDDFWNKLLEWGYFGECAPIDASVAT